MSILITGANGQIGTILTKALREKYGASTVVSSDITRPAKPGGPFVMLDILNTQRMREIIGDFEIQQVYHLPAILSANGEWNPTKTWNVNFNGFLAMLELARELKVSKLFFPSSIAVFGPTTPKVNTPQDVPMLPSTVYGMSKLAGENWCNYYHQKYGLDVRSLRYPGIIGHDSLPGGGTTDYAVEIFHAAVKKKRYTCFLKPDTRLPMIYMADAIRATLLLMEAPSKAIKVRYGYNLMSMSFNPAELARSIQKFVPDFEISYKPDFRQKIAESWCQSIDDTAARSDWAWRPEYDLDKTTEEMLGHLNKNQVQKT